MTKALTIDDFEILKNLGGGQYAKVVKAKEKNINRIVALKILSNKIFDEKTSAEIIKREIKIHHNLKHDNILKFFGYIENVNGIYMILEYCKRGEMYKDILKCKGYSNERAATYIYQLCSALHYCHKNEIIHRDIKSENILLTVTGAIKLADFGCSKRIKRENRNTFCGTLEYLAPEMLTGDAQNIKIDIWCLGVLLFEMLIVKNPFHQECIIKTRERILEVKFDVPNTVDTFANCLLHSVLRKDPMERLSAKQILTFPYIEKFAEKSLTECQAALQQWAQINDQPAEPTLITSFNIKCPTFNFDTASPVGDINIFEPGIGDFDNSLFRNLSN